MAPLPVIANTYRVAFDWSGYGTSAQNVMHFRKSASTPAAIAAAVIAAWQSGQLASVGSSSSIDSLNVTPLDGTSPTTQYLTGSSGKWVGSTSSDISPASAALVKLTTSLRGRSYRGRVYIPFQAVTALVNGAINSGSLSTMQTAWNNYFAALTAATVEWVVASYKHSTAAGVDVVTVETELGTQRRRQTRLR